MPIKTPLLVAASLGAFAATALTSTALTAHLQTKQDRQYYGDPPDENHEWAVHDMDRPWPESVDPGRLVRPEYPVRHPAPSDAVVLFNGRGMDQFRKNDGSDVQWENNRDFFEVTPGQGNIYTRETFGDCQIHVEWFVTEHERDREGQNRGNTGVFIMDRYEIQVLDTKDNRTYADGMAGSVYGQNPPLVNPGTGIGTWQTYDIIFHRPHFDEDGNCVEPATVTVLHNGILVQDHFELEGPTLHRRRTNWDDRAHQDSLPIRIQDHNERTRFRNFWVRRLD